MAFKGECVVVNAGIRGGRAALFIKSESQAFPTGRNFSTPANVTREMLAVALAAIASNKKVYCEIPTEDTDWSDVEQMNLLSGR